MFSENGDAYSWGNNYNNQCNFLSIFSKFNLPINFYFNDLFLII